MQSSFPRHFEPLRPDRVTDLKERYEFTHGTNSLCVYDLDSLQFITEIPVGEKPDCHATSMAGKYVYIACRNGLYCISQDSLRVARRLDIGPVYATNAMPDGDTLLVHDLQGGIVILKGIEDMDTIHVHRRLEILPPDPASPDRVELGGKGHFIENGRWYLCAGWKSARMFALDLDDDYRVTDFMPATPALLRGDDLVINRGKTKAYIACHTQNAPSYVAVVDIASRTVVDRIATGRGTCGLTMTADERTIAASNDADDSISVIDTQTDRVVNTLCAHAGFAALGLTGYIQGISAAKDDAIFVYGCSGNGALVRFSDITGKGSYTISHPGGIYRS